MTLTESDQRFASQSEWIDSLVERQTRGATLALLNVANQVGWRRLGNLDIHHLAKLLARDFGNDEHGRAELRRMYIESDGILTDVVERALVECADEPGILALIRRMVAERRPIEMLESAVEGLATTRDASSDAKDTYATVPVNCQSLRVALMRLIVSGGAEGDVAAQALSYLDELRDAYGWPTGETRNPSILSGQAWPIT